MVRLVRVRGYYRRRRVAVHTVTADVPRVRLRARRYRKACAGGDMYPVDALLGDDRYIFLRFGEPYYGVHGGRGAKADLCYIFDVEELIKLGAKVREEDIMSTREYVAFDIEVGDALSRHPELEIEPVQTHEMSKDDLRELIAADRKLREAWGEVKDKRDRITLEGREALEALENCDKCEVLFPHHLSLARAIAKGSFSEMQKKARALRYDEDDDDG